MLAAALPELLHFALVSIATFPHLPSSTAETLVSLQPGPWQPVASPVQSLHVGAKGVECRRLPECAPALAATAGSAEVVPGPPVLRVFSYPPQVARPCGPTLSEPGL